MVAHFGVVSFSLCNLFFVLVVAQLCCLYFDGDLALLFWLIPRFIQENKTQDKLNEMGTRMEFSNF